MSLMHPVPQPIQWFEGMLLSPQHFQQQNAYVEQLLFHQLQRVSPYFYGFLSLSFTPGTVTDNKLQIAEANAVMPDGTVINYDQKEQLQAGGEDANSVLLEYDLQELDKGLPAKKPFFLYLAIARQVGACASDTDTDTKRYESINTGKVMDQNQAQNQVDLIRLKPRLQLLSKAERTPNYSYLPVARLQKNHDGSFQRLAYTPPMLAMTSSLKLSPAYSSIGHELGSCINLLKNKAKELRSNFLEKSSSNLPLTHEQKQVLYHLSHQLPAIEVMLHSHKTHPYDMYLATVRLASSLSILKEDILPGDYKTYNHYHLDGIFAPIFKELKALTNELQLSFKTLSFYRVEDRFEYEFQQQSKDKILLSFGLNQRVSQEQLISWIEKAYICTLDKVEELALRRSIGVETRQRLESFKSLDLNAGEDEVFYQLPVDPEFITVGEKLVIMSSDDGLKRYAPISIKWFCPMLEED